MLVGCLANGILGELGRRELAREQACRICHLLSLRKLTKAPVRQLWPKPEHAGPKSRTANRTGTLESSSGAPKHGLAVLSLEPWNHI